MGYMFNAQGDLIERPQKAGDRQAMMDVHKVLAMEFGFEPNQVQSGLCHYEQSLYERLGLNTNPTTRSGGAARFLRGSRRRHSVPLLS
jgi:hypothetical protein